MHSQALWQFYLHTPHASANWMNYTCLFLPRRRWSSFTDPRGTEGWVGLGGWLHTKIMSTTGIVPDTVAHPSTNRVWRRLTLFIETNALLLHQTIAAYKWTQGQVSWLSLRAEASIGNVLHLSDEPGKLSQWLCCDDSIINIILSTIMICNKPLCLGPILYTAAFGSTQKSLTIYGQTHQPPFVYHNIF